MATNKLSILNHTSKNNQPIFDDPGFRQVVEDHLIWLQTKVGYREVKPMESFKYKHDFSAYLLSHNVEFGLHWLYMRLNDMLYNWDFDESYSYIKTLDDDVIDELIGQYTLLRSL